jgi:hypothetical protein
MVDDSIMPGASKLDSDWINPPEPEVIEYVPPTPKLTQIDFEIALTNHLDETAR